MATSVTPRERNGHRLPVLLGWAGVLGQLAVGLPYLVSGLIVPSPYVYGLWPLWFAFMGGALWLRRRRPLLVPLIPMSALAAWFVIVNLGSRFLHWTA